MLTILMEIKTTFTFLFKWWTWHGAGSQPQSPFYLSDEHDMVQVVNHIVTQVTDQEVKEH